MCCTTVKLHANQIVEELRQSYLMGKTRLIAYRKQQLKAMLSMYKEHSWDFVEALAKDLKKPTAEAIVSEINILIYDIENIIAHIDEWAKPKKVAANTATLLDTSTIYNDPYGVVLVIGAWNYPYQLPLLPVSGAIAAGNCVVIKPSEISAATEAALMKYIPLYMDKDCVRIVDGGVKETTLLLKEKFDYIFFTGSTAVGRVIRDAANKHLTPTTLELGGKSPLYLDDSVNWDMAVRRIIWGKCFNLGQTCVAPDYMLCTKQVQEKFVTKAKEVLREFYGEKWQDSPDLARMINDRNFKRVLSYIKDGTVVVGGNYDADDKWIEPTILVDVDASSKLMQEEIFGPLLPIINVESVHEAINFINERESQPLSIYVFSTISNVQELVKVETRSGGVCINDTLVHYTISALPFGGVGASGMGVYHGKASYDTFTHKKSILGRGYSGIFEFLGKNRYPPYSEKKYKLLTMALRERALPSLRPLTYLMVFGFGALSLYIGQKIAKSEENYL